MNLHVLRTTDPAEARRRVAEGGRLRRVAHDMAAEPLAGGSPGLDGGRDSGFGLDALESGFAVETLGSDAEELAAAASRATPPGHVDHEAWPGPQERTDYWRSMLAGQVCGPVLPESLIVRGPGGIGAALALTRMPAASWWPGGPWVAEVFVVPGLQGRGLGAALLGEGMRALAAVGEERLGLTVTEANPAERLYARLGFRRFRTLYVVQLG